MNQVVAAPNIAELRTQYINLLKRSLLGLSNGDYSRFARDHWWQRAVLGFFQSAGYELVKPASAIDQKEGLHWPLTAMSMVGEKRLNNIQFCVEKVIADNVPGDLIETGVWKGGSCIFMRGILKAHGVTDRTVWVADSFEGFPKDLNESQDQSMKGYIVNNEVIAVSLERVKSHFQNYELLDDQVKFLKGWFKDTLPTAPVKQLSILRLDGDYYESTMDALKALYPKLSSGGFAIVDDYGSWPMCKAAVDEYRAANNITEKIEVVDRTGVYWRKS